MEGPADGSADAPSETSAPCLAGSFGAPAPIAELNTSLDERGLRFATGELTAVFSRGGTSAGRPDKTTGIYMATRSSLTEAFGGPFAATYQAGEVYPSLTGNAGSLFFELDCYWQTSGPGTLCLITSEPDAGFFNGPIPVFSPPLLNAGPFGAGRTAGDGFVTPGGGAYYLAYSPYQYQDDGGFQSDGGGPLDSIYVIHTVDPPMFGPPLDPVYVPADATMVVDNPVLTADELTMYLSATSAQGPVPHVYVASRSKVDDPFGSLRPLHELDSAEGEYPSWISADGCRLYITRTVSGQRDLYVATRSP